LKKENILEKILEVYQICNISSFPVDCLDLISKCGITCKSYSSLSRKKQEHCLLVSEEAFTLKNEIYYNDKILDKRIRFSLIHELGHIMLNHKENRSEAEEREANFFATNLLAPRIVIHYSGCKNLADVIKRFDLSEEAAGYAFSDYKYWLRKIKLHFPDIENQIYQHFFNTEINQLVWSISECECCFFHPAYNGSKVCPSCFIANLKKHKNSYDTQEYALDLLRSQKLYGDI